MPRKYFTIDGVATYLHHTGATTLPETPPDLSQGEVLLCLHGSGRHGGDFDALLPTLAAADHSPLAFDQPGHGRSGGLDSLGSIERMSAFTRALTSKLALRPHVLLGHSLGAALALDLALEHPTDVRGLVIVAGGAGFSFTPEYLDNARLVTEGKRRRDFDATAFAKGTDPGVMRRAFMAGMKTDPRASYGDLLAADAWSSDEKRQAELANISTPTLVVHGDSERAEVVEQADRLVSLLPNCRKAVVEDAAEMILYEQPEALASLATTFLGELA